MIEEEERRAGEMDLVEERDTKVCVKALYKYIMLELKTDEDALIGADFILKIV